MLPKISIIKAAKAGWEERIGPVCSKLIAILQMEDEEPIIKEALWDEACGQYVAAVDDCGTEKQLEIWILTL